MQTVYLVDQGQDFLEWDIEDGKVVACRPLQGWLWNGTEVHNTNIQPGDILDITTPRGRRTTLNHPVERVKEKPPLKCRDCGLLSAPKVFREGENPAVRCTLGLWDKQGVEHWYSYGQSQLNRGPVRRFGEACTQGRPKDSKPGSGSSDTVPSAEW